MDENHESEIEPEAKQEEKEEEKRDEDVPMRDEGLDRSASGALRPLGD